MIQGKLGKLAPKIDHRTLKMRNYVTGHLSPAPTSFDQTAKASPNWGMMMNDTLGDCVIAAAAHQQQIWTSDVTAEVTAPDTAILQAYEAIGGYVPGNPATDNGCVMLDALNYWRKNGLFGHQLGAYVSVNPKSRYEVMDAIFYFGGLFIGLAMPVTAQQQQEWERVDGTPDSAPGSWGGHAVAACGYQIPDGHDSHPYTQRTVKAITWGQPIEMTWNFFSSYCDEAYALLSPDWLNPATGLCPEGFNLIALQADLAAIQQV